MQNDPKWNVVAASDPVKDIWTKVDPNIDVKTVSSVKNIEITQGMSADSGLVITLFCHTPEDRLDEEREVKVVFKNPNLSWRIVDSRMVKYHDTPSNWKDHDDIYWLFEATNSDYLDWFNGGSMGLESDRIRHYVINLEKVGQRIDVISYYKPIVTLVETTDKSHFMYKFVHMSEEELRLQTIDLQGDF